MGWNDHMDCCKEYGILEELEDSFDDLSDFIDEFEKSLSKVSKKLSALEDKIFSIEGLFVGINFDRCHSQKLQTCLEIVSEIRAIYDKEVFCDASKGVYSFKQLRKINRMCSDAKSEFFDKYRIMENTGGCIERSE